MLANEDYYENVKEKGESHTLVPTDNRGSEMRQFEGQGPPQLQFQRGRIHDKVDVIGGVSGLEHLSNSLAYGR